LLKHDNFCNKEDTAMLKENQKISQKTKKKQQTHETKIEQKNGWITIECKESKILIRWNFEIMQRAWFYCTHQTKESQNICCELNETASVCMRETNKQEVRMKNKRNILMKKKDKKTVNQKTCDKKC